MAAELNKITSGVNPTQKKAKRGRKAILSERGERARKVPDYEDVANWSGIEDALSAVRFDRATAAGVETPRFFSVNVANISPAESILPTETVEQSGKSSLYVGSMSEAISSALGAMRPQLLRMAENDARRASGDNAPSPETLVQYQHHTTSLIAQYQKYSGLRDAENINWIEFAEWFITRQVDLPPSTWQTYRSALTSYLERIPSDDAAAASSLLHSIEELAAKKENHASSRVKFILPVDFNRIIWHCDRYPTQTNSRLANYLRANVRIGLRPVEYLSSEIRIIPDDNAPHGRQAWLFVCNAKYGHGRANGPVRLLDLSAMNDEAIDVIYDCIDEAKMQSQIIGYDRWLSSLNNALNRIAKSPKSAVTTRYTAYSARHQAVANWKSLYDSISVAALAGHVMPSTATQHYGRAKYAWPEERLKNMIVRPCLGDVKRIQARVLSARRIRSAMTGGGMAPDMQQDDLAPSM